MTGQGELAGAGPQVPRVYLAGPEVFLPDAATIGRAKRAVCQRYGLEGCFPVEPIDGLGELGHLPPRRRALAFFDVLVEQLDGCDALIANLTPFRGVSADVGTVWELGYAAGRGLPVFGYTNIAGVYADRVTPDGLLVEHFELADNLMVEGSVRRHGSWVVQAEPARPDGAEDAADALRGLSGFERCVQAAAQRLGRWGTPVPSS